MDESTTNELCAILHELSNVLTGILVTGGLMQLALQADPRQRYAAEICSGSERGASLVRQARALVLGSEEQIPEPLRDTNA